MTHFTIKDNFKKILTLLVIAAFWLAVWQLAYLKVAQELLLVSPAQAFIRLLTLARLPLFWDSVVKTCLRVMAGFFLALITGTAAAILTSRFRLISMLVTPLFAIIKATPVASFIILALLWFSSDKLPVFISFLMVVPMIWSNIFTGITQADQSLLEMAKIFKLSRRKIFSAIYVPEIMPHFISACSVGLGFAWKSAIAAEIICIPKAAIGKQIKNSQIYLETADLFAWTIAVIILSLLIEKVTIGALKQIGKSILPTREKENA